MVEEENKYIESDKPSSEHKYNGWHYHSETKKFYRYDDLPPYEGS